MQMFPLGTVPSMVGVVPSMVGVVPSMVRVVPSMVGVVPSMVRVVPSMVGVVPSMVRVVPSMVGVVPSMVGVLPSMVVMVPSMLGVVPSMLGKLDRVNIPQGAIPRPEARQRIQFSMFCLQDGPFQGVQVEYLPLVPVSLTFWGGPLFLGRGFRIERERCAARGAVGRY